MVDLEGGQLSPFEPPDSLEVVYQDVDTCSQCSIASLTVNLNRSKLRGMEKKSNLCFVGQNPSYYRSGDRDFYTSESGKILTRALNKVGLDREDVFVTNVVKCSTPTNKPLKKVVIQSCLPYLIRELALVHPKLIVALGAIACKVFRAKVGEFSQWGDTEVFGLPHPAYILHGGMTESQYCELMKEVRQRVDSWS